MLTKESLGNKKPSFLRAYKEALLWAIFLLVLFILPGDELPSIDFWEINIEDKLAHIAVFAVLAGLMVLGAQRGYTNAALPFRIKFRIFMICLLFGIFTEALQGLFIPSRYASFADVLADGMGASLGIVFAPWVLRITGFSVR